MNVFSYIWFIKYKGGQFHHANTGWKQCGVVEKTQALERLNSGSVPY